MGRDSSPVLDKYPPKDPARAPRAPPPVARTVAAGSPPSVPSRDAGPSPTAPSATSPVPGIPPPVPLITLERPFDLDAFSALLGETSIRLTVPRSDLPEVLRRVTEFMGFGIYVYAISLRPAPSELLKAFVVELRRVDYSPEKGAWVPFVEKGAGDSPFAGEPGSRRTE